MSRRSRLSSEIDQETSVLVGEGAANTEQVLKPHELGLPVSGRIGLAKIVSSLVLVGGMALLWLYGALGTLADPSALDRLARSPEIISVFSDPLKLGLVALVSFIPLFFLRRRHKTESRLLISKLL